LKVPWTPFNLGVFLVIFGGLLFASLAGISHYDAGTSFTLTIMIFGVWLALAAFILTPPDKYAPHRMLVFGWGALLAALGVVLFVAVTQGPALPIVFSILIIIAGIGALGYSLVRAGDNDRTPKPPPTGTSNL
jgi:uncharacterized membrane protein YczE